jgi:hypothetical protein
MKVNPEVLRRQIDETDPVAAKAELAADAKHKALAEQEAVTEQLVKEQTDRDRNPLDSLKDLQWLYRPVRFLAGVLFAADVPVQFALTTVAFPALHLLARVIVAVVVAGGIGAGVAVTAVALLFDLRRPRRTFRLCVTWAGVVGVLAALAGTVCLFARTASGDMVNFLAEAVPVSLWVLGETLPITAGFLSAAVWTIGCRERRDRRIQQLKSRLAELARFLDWLENDTKKCMTTSTVVLLLCACLLTTPAICQGGLRAPSGARSAGTSSSSVTHVGDFGARTNIGAPGRANNRCLFAPDMTYSVDPEYRRATVSTFTQSVRAFVSAFECSVLAVGTWADEGPFAPITELQVPLPPPNEDCSKATFTANGMEQITKEIAGFREYYRKRAEDACLAASRSRLADFDEKMRDLAEQVRGILNPDLPARGQCTAIYSFVSWAVSRNGVVVLSTDGIETCERGRPTLHLPAQTRLMLILLPSRASVRNAGGAAMRLATQWERQVPGLKVVMPSEVTPALWNEIAAERP